MLTCRTFALMFVAALSILAGCPNSVQACCLSWLGSCFGGCGCDGSYGTGYSGYYGAGYSGGYYGGYAPVYDGCSGCGTAGAGYGYGGGYGDGGCSSCADGGCGVNAPGTYAPQRPVDGFQEGPGRDNLNDSPRRNRITPIPRKDDALPPKKTPPREKPDPQDDGFGIDPNRVAPEESPINGGVDKFDQPLRRRRPTGDEALPETNAKKPPMPAETVTPTESKPAAEPASPDDFPTDDATNTPMKTNRPVLGIPEDTEDDSSNKSVIPNKVPAPIDVPEEPAVEQPVDAEELNLDDKESTSAVSPKMRLALQARFRNPTIARIRLRPNHKWIATPQDAKLAKH